MRIEAEKFASLRICFKDNSLMLPFDSETCEIACDFSDIYSRLVILMD
jgi:hypothetical protein